MPQPPGLCSVYPQLLALCSPIIGVFKQLYILSCITNFGLQHNLVLGTGQTPYGTLTRPLYTPNTSRYHFLLHVCMWTSPLCRIHVWCVFVRTVCTIHTCMYVVCVSVCVCACASLYHPATPSTQHPLTDRMQSRGGRRGTDCLQCTQDSL